MARHNDVRTFADAGNRLARILGRSKTHVTDLSNDFLGVFDRITSQNHALSIRLGKAQGLTAIGMPGDFEVFDPFDQFALLWQHSDIKVGKQLMNLPRDKNVFRMGRSRIG